MGISILPARADILFYFGTDFPFLATLTGKTDPINITGDTVVFTITDQNNGEVYKQTNTVHSAPSVGQTEFFIPHSITRLWERETSRWFYEIRRIVAADSREYVHLVGQVKAA